jgi:hypothetical protein
MQFWKVGALLLSLLTMPVSAQAMTVADWVQRLNTLKSRGNTAQGSPELMMLQTEVAIAATSYRAQINEAKEKARRPRACPPARVSLSAEDLALEFRKLPQNLYLGELSIAFGVVMDKRYPCTDQREVAPSPTIPAT